MNTYLNFIKQTTNIYHYAFINTNKHTNYNINKYIIKCTKLTVDQIYYTKHQKIHHQTQVARTNYVVPLTPSQNERWHRWPWANKHALSTFDPQLRRVNRMLILLTRFCWLFGAFVDFLMVLLTRSTRVDYNSIIILIKW